MTPRRSLIVCLFVILAVIAWIVWLNDPMRSVFGSDGMKFVRKPTRVEAYRVTADFTKGEIHDDVTDYALVGKPVSVDVTHIVDIQDGLTSRSSYDANPKACTFQPGVRVDFYRGDEVLQVLFCFRCDELASYRNGRPVGHADFDPARAKLLRGIKSLFPDDPAIQSLRE